MLRGSILMQKVLLSKPLLEKLGCQSIFFFSKDSIVEAGARLYHWRLRHKIVCLP